MEKVCILYQYDPDQRVEQNVLVKTNCTLENLPKHLCNLMEGIAGGFGMSLDELVNVLERQVEEV